MTAGNPAFSLQIRAASILRKEPQEAGSEAFTPSVTGREWGKTGAHTAGGVGAVLRFSDAISLARVLNLALAGFRHAHCRLISLLQF